jgi:hypothetical protein
MRRSIQLGTLVALIAMSLLLSACNLPFTSSGGGPSAGEDGRAPEQVLADAKSAVAGFKTVHVVFKTNDKEVGDVTFDVSIDESGNITGSGDVGGTKFDVVVVGDKSYVRGSAFFAKQLASSGGDPGTRAVIQQKIGDHWVTGLSFLTNDKQLKTDVLADCLDQHGTLSKKGTDTVNGKKVVVVEDRGEEPGGQPATIYVAYDAPHVLVRVAETGKRTPGTEGMKGKCAATTATPLPTSGAGSAAAPQPSSIDFSDYGKPVKVDTPTDTVDIAALFSSGG